MNLSYFPTKWCVSPRIGLLVICVSLLSPLSTLESIGADKYVPSKGAYLGAVLDWADVATAPGTNTIEKFAYAMHNHNKLTEKNHVLYEQFFYFPHGAEWEDPKYSGKFCTWDSDPCNWATPKEFVKACEKVGATPVLTIEPHVITNFFDKWIPGNIAYDHTVNFAKEIGAWGKPIFIRFAHEMNGSWYAWSGWNDKNKNLKRDPGEQTEVTPSRYRSAYRNFATVFRKEAPNAALIWCPNQGWLGLRGEDNYTPFYPGDDVVDWVGIDFYERGWFQPAPDSHLWGGMFHAGMHRDDADDPTTTTDESINFYKTYHLGKGKPIMVCETGAQQTYRTDLSTQQRTEFSHAWKAGYWNAAEYGWLYQLFGTSKYDKKQLQYRIDQQLPGIKAIIWFNQAKHESTPGVRKKPGASQHDEPTKEEIVWYKDAWCDFRIGYNSPTPETKATSKNDSEVTIYKELIKNDYFLPTLVNVNVKK